MEKDKLFLIDMKLGQEKIIQSLPLGRGLQRRLISMGLVPGTSITYVRGGHGQPYVLERDGCQLVIGQGLAMMIEVGDTLDDIQEIKEHRIITCHCRPHRGFHQRHLRHMKNDSQEWFRRSDKNSH